MSLPWYPTTLPAPLAENFREARGDGRTVGRTDAGPPIRRRRFSAVPKSVSFSTILYPHELSKFNRFYEEDTAEGTLPFLMPDPINNGALLLTAGGVPLLTAGGSPILITSTWLCVFGDELPVVTPSGLEWRVTFSLLVLP